MSNPTTAVFDLQSSLGGTGSAGSIALTGVEPIRYDSGLYLEEGTTNFFINPGPGGGSATGWIQAGSATVGYGEDGDGPYATLTRTSGAMGYQNGTAEAPLVAPGEVVTIQGKLRSPNATLNCRVRIRFYDAASAGGSQVGESLGTLASVGSSWVGFEHSGTAPASTVSARVTFLNTDTGSGGDVLHLKLAQGEVKSYATSYTDGTLGTGYAWTGTDYASTSTRAASSASLSPAGIIDTYLGAIVFRLTPTIETEVEEVWGELGEKGAGTDHIQWGRDSSKHPFVEWSGNDSAYTRITLDGTVDAGDEHFYSIEWHVGDEIFTLYQDALPGESDAIPSPQEDYGGESLTLKASAGGVIYNGILIANERLTDEQRATLLSKENWSMNTLSAPQRRYEFFQLRPGV